MKSLVEIVWMDAAIGTTDKDKSESPSSLLWEQHTYGFIYQIDDDATIICTSENKDEIEYAVIPNRWIKKIIQYHQIKNEK